MSTSTVSPLLKIGLGLIGMWPGASHATLCWLFYMTTLVAMQYFQYSYVYAHLDFSNLTELMDGLGLTLDYTLTILKLLSLWFNRRIFADILVGMDDDWKDCGTDLRECVMMDKANLAHRCSNAMISVNALATFLYFIDSYVRGSMLSKDGQLREFPIQIQFPFEVHETPFYQLVGLGLFFHVLETATVIAMLNALILTLSLGTNMTSKSAMLIQFIIPYLAVTIEAFVFCFAGEYLSTKSRAIGDAAYEAVWYDLSISECRILLFVILRSQKRLTITAGKIIDLTLEGFTTYFFLRDILLDHESFSFIYFGFIRDVLKHEFIYAGHTYIVKSSRVK
ncbi:uncharacterized protein LOC112459412 isoform X4 [Temnothorax curvispinosus]|uniref:Uncharacterized protein LOC112459412 isoform X4 n=1 Tax=Temnothorax curvispinosus TaxID=300111 RepID=A0A6J1QAB2_9HYME|nr:uncharacterized protein LOC112459412 isoform X4 [Temnothorax curvispinosus]